MGIIMADRWFKFNGIRANGFEVFETWAYPWWCVPSDIACSSVAMGHTTKELHAGSEGKF